LTNSQQEKEREPHKCKLQGIRNFRQSRFRQDKQILEEIEDRIMAVSSLDSEDIYVFVAKKKIDEDEDRTKSKGFGFFEPNEKMLKSIRLMIPGKVFE